MAENSSTYGSSPQAVAAPHAARLEEWANLLTHGIGLLLSLVGVVVLVVLATLAGDPVHIVSISIFGATLVLMYAASTLYHSFTSARLKHAFRILDHVSIYWLIAGSYTPFLLVLFDDPWRSALLVTVWTIALAGTVFKLFFTGRFERLSLLLYVGMGWLIVVALEPLLTFTPPGALGWLLASGLLYTGGVLFYAWERLPYNHAIWHLFVLGGSTCHYFAVTFYVVPW